MNKVQLVGRLTKDIELKRTQSGKSVTSFSLAVNRYGKKDEADFISCVAWGATAEIMNKYLHKGNRIAVCGRINVRTYDKDGKKQYVTEVVADEVEFLTEKQNDSKPNNFEPIDDDGELPF